MTKCEPRMAFDYELSTVHCEVNCGLICPAVQRRRLVQLRWKTGRLCGKRERINAEVAEERRAQTRLSTVMVWSAQRGEGPDKKPAREPNHLHWAPRPQVSRTQ